MLDVVIARLQPQDPVRSLANFIGDSESTRVFLYDQCDQCGGGAAHAQAQLGRDPRVRVIQDACSAGREAHAYVLHVATHYDALADHVMFLQGNPFAHMNRVWSGTTFAAMMAGTDGPVHPRSIIDEQTPPRHSSRVDVHEAARQVLGFALSSYRFSVGSQYVVSRERLRRRPVTWWKRLLHMIESDMVNSWEMERLWMYVFDLLQVDRDLISACVPPAPSALGGAGSGSRKRRTAGIFDMKSFLDHLRRNTAGFHPDATRKIDTGTGAVPKGLLKLFELVSPDLLIQVGDVWKGKKAIALAKMMKPGARLLCVDSWLGSGDCWTVGIGDRARGGAMQLVHGYPSVYYSFINNVFASQLQDVVVPLPFPIAGASGAKDLGEVLGYYKCEADAIAVQRLDWIEDLWPHIRADGGVMFGVLGDAPDAEEKLARFVREHGADPPSVHGGAWFVRKRGERDAIDE